MSLAKLAQQRARIAAALELAREPDLLGRGARARHSKLVLAITAGRGASRARASTPRDKNIKPRARGRARDLYIGAIRATRVIPARIRDYAS